MNPLPPANHASTMQAFLLATCNTTRLWPAGARQKILQSSLGGLHQCKCQSQWSDHSKGGKEWSDHWDFIHIKEIWRSQLHKGITMVTAMHAVLAEAKVHRRPRRYFKRRRVCTFCEIVISEMWRFGAIFFQSLVESRWTPYQHFSPHCPL